MIKRTQVLGLVGIAGLAAWLAQVSGPAPAYARSSDRQCFLAGTVDSFSPARDSSFVDVRAGGPRWFRLELGAGCPDANWLMQVGIKPTHGSWICDGADAELIAPGTFGHQRCLVTSVRQLTPAEVQEAINRK
jgi:hypothetical protein